jgi:hypothetical protein
MITPDEARRIQTDRALNLAGLVAATRGRELAGLKFHPRLAAALDRYSESELRAELQRAPFGSGWASTPAVGRALYEAIARKAHERGAWQR